MAERPRNSTRPAARAAKPSPGPDHALRVAALLAEAWPEAHVELDHQNAYQLLVATILAAQSTDRMINTITPALFARYPDARALAAAEPSELEPLVFKSGFYRNKARALVGMARALVERHRGQVPTTMDELVALPGVARKTANVVLANALGKNEGVIVDTHVQRLSQRLGLTSHDDPVKIEQDLMRLLPREQWNTFANRLIWHGRRVCFARNPDHEHCVLAPECPSAALVPLGGGRRGEVKATAASGRASTRTRPRATADADAPVARTARTTPARRARR